MISDVVSLHRGENSEKKEKKNGERKEREMTHWGEQDTEALINRLHGGVVCEGIV